MHTHRERCQRGSGPGRAGDSRDVDALGGAVGAGGLDLEEAVGHDEVDGAGAEEVAVQAGDDLAERLDEGADLDGANRGRWGRKVRSAGAGTGVRRTGEEGREGGVGLGGHDGHVVVAGAESLEDAHGLSGGVSGSCARGRVGALTPQPPPTMTRWGLSTRRAFCSSCMSLRRALMTGRFLGPPRSGWRARGETGTPSMCCGGKSGGQRAGGGGKRAKTAHALSVGEGIVDEDGGDDDDAADDGRGEQVERHADGRACAGKHAAARRGRGRRVGCGASVEREGAEGIRPKQEADTRDANGTARRRAEAQGRSPKRSSEHAGRAMDGRSRCSWTMVSTKGRISHVSQS